MDDEDIDDHRTRKLLLAYIRDNPGATFQILKSVFRMKDGTLRYHLDRLKKKNKIVQENKGKDKSYYSNIRKVFPYNDPRLKLSERQEWILEIIHLSPGIGEAAIQRETGMERTALSYDLRQLTNKKLIWKRNGMDGPGFEVITKDALAGNMFLILVNEFLEGKISKVELMVTLEKLKRYRDR